MNPSLSVTELKDLLKNTHSLVLLDVRRRTDMEADPESIPSASWQDPDHVDGWLPQLPKHAQVVVFCVRGGNVSRSVRDKLIQGGVSASVVEGGLAAWKSAAD